MSVELVSIIIPTFNRATLIPETIDSIISQTHTNWECIIVDDGSTDSTEEVVNAYVAKDARIQFHHRPENAPKGANACRNYGLKISKGKYINWFDSDDLLHPQKFEKQVDALEHSDYNFSACQTLIFLERLENTQLRYEKLISDEPFVDYMGLKIGFMTPSPMWKRAFLIENDYFFDETLQAAQEWEFHSRILFRHKKYHTIDEPLVFVRKHYENITYEKASFKPRDLNYLNARIKILDRFKGKLSDKELLFFSHYFIYTYFDFKRKGYGEAKSIFANYISKDFRTLRLFLKTRAFTFAYSLLKALKIKSS